MRARLEVLGLLRGVSLHAMCKVFPSSPLEESMVRHCMWCGHPVPLWRQLGRLLYFGVFGLFVAASQPPGSIFGCSWAGGFFVPNPRHYVLSLLQRPS